MNPQSLVPLVVVGATGRMGRAVVRLAGEHGFDLRSTVGRRDVGRDAGELAGVGTLGVAIGSELAFRADDVVIDFSSPSLFGAVAKEVARSGARWVCGVTGLEPAHLQQMADVATRAGVVHAANTSVGVWMLRKVVAEVARSLPAWAVEIVELHHDKKVDAPSGTALALAAEVQTAHNGALKPTFGRLGTPGARTTGELGFHAVRGGDVIGEHTVYFFGEGERIELTHRASNRDLFARGALRAAAWLADRPNGLYTFDDVMR